MRRFWLNPGAQGKINLHLPDRFPAKRLAFLPPIFKNPLDK
jgi:hypothetical protein